MLLQLLNQILKTKLLKILTELQALLPVKVPFSLAFINLKLS